MEVVTAESSEAALAQIVSGLDADVLVTDVRMPGPSGPKVAEAFRERDPEAPVIFISGYSDTEGIVEGADPARTRFLSKPFAPDLLVATVRELLRHRRATSAQSPSAP